MTHRKDKAEEQAIALLQRVVAISEADRDALPRLGGKARDARHRDHAEARRQEAPAGPTSKPVCRLISSHGALICGLTAKLHPAHGG
jgi:hypothetical protein